MHIAHTGLIAGRPASKEALSPDLASWRDSLEADVFEAEAERCVRLALIIARASVRERL